MKIALVIEYPTDANFYQFCLFSKELLKYNHELNIYIPNKTLFFDKNQIKKYSKHIPIIKHSINDINSNNFLIITNKKEKKYGNNIQLSSYTLFKNKENILYIQYTNCYDICNYNTIGYKLKKRTLCRDEVLTCLIPYNIKLNNNINFPILENYNIKKEVVLTKEKFYEKFHIDKNKKIIAIFLPHSMKIRWVSIKNLLKNIEKYNSFLNTQGFQLIGKLHIKQKIKNEHSSLSYENYKNFLKIPIIEDIDSNELYSYCSFAISIWSVNAYYLPCLNIPTLVFDMKCFCKKICTCNFNNKLNMSINNKNYQNYVLKNGKICNITFGSNLKSISNHRKITTNYHGYICFIEDFVDNYQIILNNFINRDYSICHEDNYKIFGNMNYTIEDYTKMILKYIIY